MSPAASPPPEPQGTSPDTAASERQASDGRSGSWGAAFVASFTTVFLAELGDKTQLAALLLSAQSGRPVLVFVGASLALICSSLVGVLLGRWLSRIVPAQQLERAAGILMVALGLWLGRQAVLQLSPPSLDLPLS
jgi:putative Ca2+/H+ antiporter (TMEM165/GDT1 family)